MGPVYSEAHLLDGDHPFKVGFKAQSSGFPYSIAEHIQGSCGGYSGVQLPQRAGCRISRVGKAGKALVRPLYIQCFEGLNLHIDFTPHFYEFGYGYILGKGPQNQGNGEEGLDVGRHVFSHVPISSSGGHTQFSVFVDQFHGYPVDFWLYRILEGSVFSQESFGPGVKVPNIFFAETVFQAEHGPAVSDLGEGLEGFVSNPLGGGVRGHPFRVLPFKFQ